MTRGNNIVADGWAGAYNLHQQPRPPPHTHRHRNDKMKNAWVFALFNSITTDGWMDGQTKLLIVACPHLKTKQSQEKSIFVSYLYIWAICQDSSTGTLIEKEPRREYFQSFIHNSENFWTTLHKHIGIYAVRWQIFLVIFNIVNVIVIVNFLHDRQFGVGGEALCRRIFGDWGW